MPFNQGRRLRSWRVLLWLLPAFGLWWVTVIPLLTGLALPVGLAAEAWFQREQLQLEVANNGSWHLHTRIVLKRQPEYGSDRFVLNQMMPSLVNFTLGLPLLWILLLAVPEAIKPKLGKLFAGSLLLILPMGLTLWLVVVDQMARIMASDLVDYVFVMKGTYLPVAMYPTWVLKLLPLFISGLDYINRMIIPLLIGLGFNRRFLSLV